MNWTRVNDGLMQSGKYLVLKTLVQLEGCGEKIVTYGAFHLESQGAMWLGSGDTFREAQTIVTQHAQCEYDHAGS